MLANVFKTAAELGIPEHERAALIELLYCVEDGTIPLSEIFMPKFHCGTSHCLAGWANTIDPEAFPGASPANFYPDGRCRDPQKFVSLTPDLKRLFCVGWESHRVTTAEVAVANLRVYLETGKCP